MANEWGAPERSESVRDSGSQNARSLGKKVQGGKRDLGSLELGDRVALRAFSLFSCVSFRAAFDWEFPNSLAGRRGRRGRALGWIA